MTRSYYWTDLNCHWCGSVAKRPKTKRTHVFCSNRCKMAHRRAYHRYVTHMTRLNQARVPSSNARHKKNL